jgi:hypothetical protein
MPNGGANLRAEDIMHSGRYKGDVEENIQFIGKDELIASPVEREVSTTYLVMGKFKHEPESGWEQVVTCDNIHKAKHVAKLWNRQIKNEEYKVMKRTEEEC